VDATTAQNHGEVSTETAVLLVWVCEAGVGSTGSLEEIWQHGGTDAVELPVIADFSMPIGIEAIPPRQQR
jgi:hypothetical protein